MENIALHRLMEYEFAAELSKDIFVSHGEIGQCIDRRGNQYSYKNFICVMIWSKKRDYSMFWNIVRNTNIYYKHYYREALKRLSEH